MSLCTGWAELLLDDTEKGRLAVVSGTADLVGWCPIIVARRRAAECHAEAWRRIAQARQVVHQTFEPFYAMTVHPAAATTDPMGEGIRHPSATT